MNGGTASGTSAQIGHGRRSSSANHSGNIDVTAIGGDVQLVAGGGAPTGVWENFGMIGHGGDSFSW